MQGRLGLVFSVFFLNWFEDSGVSSSFVTVFRGVGAKYHKSRK